MKKYCVLTISYLLILTLLLASCGKEEKVGESTRYHIYYLSSERNGIDSKDYDIDMINDGDIVNRLVTLMELSSVHPLLVINNVIVDKDTVTLDFNHEFYNLSKSDEALIKMVVVKTLTQVASVEKVLITIEGNYIKDGQGNICYAMSCDDFLERGEDTIAPDKSEIITLYYADKSRDSLVNVDREVKFSDAKTIEKVIIDLIIAGPIKGEKCKAVINNKTKVNSVQIQGEVCFIDFSEQFLNLPQGESSELAVYSIVNSLTKLENINSVVITVNGDSNAGFLTDYEDNLYTNYGIIK